MPATIEIVTTRPGRTLTVSAFPDRSDTVSAGLDGVSLTEATNRPGVYSFENTDATGLHLLILSEDDAPVWQCWAVLATDGDITAAETREAALAVAAIEAGLARQAKLDTLESRLTADRAGLLDKLNVPGDLANTDNADSFKADTSGLSTFDPETDKVTVETNEDKSGYALTSAYDAAKTAAQAGAAMTLVNGAITQAKTGSDLRVKLDATQGDYAPAKAGDAMTLTSGERSAIATAVEAAIINETDSAAVLEAITDKIAEANPDLSDLTLSAIATAAKNAVLNAMLSNHDGAGTIGKAIADVLAKTANLPNDPASETNATSNRNAITSVIADLNDLGPDDVEDAAAAALAEYGPPSRAEATADKEEILTALESVTVDPEVVEAAIQDALSSEELAIRVSSFSPAAIAQLASKKQLVLLHCGVLAGGKLVCIQGDAYLEELGNAWDFPRSDFPDLTGSETVTLAAERLPVGSAADAIRFSGKIVATTGVKVLRFERETEQTLEWSPGNYQARATVTFPDGNMREFLSFELQVLPRI